MVEKTLVQRYVNILGVVAAYWFVSITLVFVNKSLLSGSTKLEAPLFVTFYQCVVTVGACYAIRAAARMFPHKITFPSLELDMKIMKQVRHEFLGMLITLLYLFRCCPSLLYLLV